MLFNRFYKGLQIPIFSNIIKEMMSYIGGHIVNKTIVIYSSKTGFTRKYAKWICEALDADILEYNDRERVNYAHYDTVIFGGGMYAGKINNIKWFREKLPHLEDKKCVLYVTGAMSKKSPDVLKNIKNNFKPGEWGKFKCFYMQGGLDYDHMDEMDRMMLKAFRYMLKLSKKDERTANMIAKSFDFTSKKDIQPLVDYCMN